MNGGAVVIDYTISWDNATGGFSVLANNITGTTYTATGIKASLTYTFVV